MKKILKIVQIFILIMLIFIFGKISKIYGVERLVDIPVPPSSSGYTDFSSNDEKNESQKEVIENTANELLGKSGNNYLKMLEVEGYQISPKFESQINNYVLELNDNIDSVLKLKISAEAEENDHTKIEGIGTIEITNEINVININVIAENGNLNVYTINIKKNHLDYNSENEIENKVENSEIRSENTIDNTENKIENTGNKINNIEKTEFNIKSDKMIIIIILFFVIFIIFYSFSLKKSKKGKHNK